SSSTRADPLPPLLRRPWLAAVDEVRELAVHACEVDVAVALLALDRCSHLDGKGVCNGRRLLVAGVVERLRLADLLDPVLARRVLLTGEEVAALLLAVPGDDC